MSSKVNPVRTQKPVDNVTKLWQSNVIESQNREEKKVKGVPVSNSAKIKDITKAFEQKDIEAHSAPDVTKRSGYRNRSSSGGNPPWKSLDLTDSGSARFTTTEMKPPSPLSPNSPKALMPRDQRFSHPVTSYQETTTSDKVRNRL